MHPLRWHVLVLLVAPAVLAGCTGPDEAEATTPTPSTHVATAPPPTVAGFVVDGPFILPLDGANRSLREDDGALVRYSLRQPDTAAGPATALVSYLLNRTVEDVQSVTLAPGQSKSFEHRLQDLRGLKQVEVEVRAGPAVAKASSPVLAWPRAYEPLVLGEYVQVVVGAWAIDALTGETVVNATVTRGAAQFWEFRSHLLCADGTGSVKSVGTVRPALQPEPGTVEMIELRLPLCPNETYGVDFKADVADGKNVYGRVLFVPPGWAPPATDA